MWARWHPDPPPPFDERDPASLARRDPVWQALADLYLDSQMDADDHAYVARVVRASGYTLAEVEAILRHEVGPAFRWNLQVPVGVWGAWDEAHVRRAVGRRARAVARRVRAGRWGGWWHRLWSSDALDTDLADWRAIRRLLLEGAAPEPPGGAR